MGWSVRVRYCAIFALNSEAEDGFYEEEGKPAQGSSDREYSRAASNTRIPASIISKKGSGDAVRNVQFKIIQAHWSLYYKEIGSGNKSVEFNDGTVFTVDHTAGTLTVTKCIRGLDGTYTKSSEKSADGGILYRTSTDIKKRASCNWEKRAFSIGVDEQIIDCGNRTYTGTEDNPTMIGVHSGLEANGANKQPAVRFDFNRTTEQACTAASSFHPFAAAVNFVGQASSQGLYPTEMDCHTNSVQKPIDLLSCVKGTLRALPGEDVLECAPGPKQAFVNVSGFTRAETIFNGAYEYNQTKSTSTWPVWKHTTNNNIRIEISKTAANKLELRDSSSAVWYIISIVKSPNAVSNPTLDVLFNTKPPSRPTSPTPSIITAVFSEKEEGLRPCDLWSRCVEDNSRKDGALTNGIVACRDSANKCAAPVAGSTSTATLTTVAKAGIKIYPMVNGDAGGALYGRDTGETTTLYVVVPDGAPMTGQKGKVLVIPQAAADAATVRDATLAVTSSTSSSTWTIDAQVASNAESGTEVGPTPPVGPPADLACGDLVSCATTLEFSSCAAAAVECASKPKPQESTHTLNHEEKKDIKLFPLGPDVLYGTDADNAYVVATKKEKVLVAPLDKKADAVVLDAEKAGTVWTSKRDKTMMWIIIISSVGGLFVLLLGLLIVVAVRNQTPQTSRSPLRYRTPYPINPGVGTAPTAIPKAPL